MGWTSIYQLFWGSLGTRVLTHPHIMWYNRRHWEMSPTILICGFVERCWMPPVYGNFKAEHHGTTRFWGITGWWAVRCQVSHSTLIPSTSKETCETWQWIYSFGKGFYILGRFISFLGAVRYMPWSSAPWAGRLGSFGVSDSGRSEFLGNPN